MNVFDKWLRSSILGFRFRSANRVGPGSGFATINLDQKFWNDCFIVVKLMSSLMRLLRIVDCDERPSMRYVYEGMYRDCLGIKKLFNHNK